MSHVYISHSHVWSITSHVPSMSVILLPIVLVPGQVGDTIACEAGVAKLIWSMQHGSGTVAKHGSGIVGSTWQDCPTLMSVVPLPVVPLPCWFNCPAAGSVVPSAVIPLLSHVLHHHVQHHHMTWNTPIPFMAFCSLRNSENQTSSRVSMTFILYSCRDEPHNILKQAL
jgi:hypothetical protein